MRVVLDSNVILAAFATHGLCEAVYAACLLEHDLFISTPLLNEITENLAAKFKASPDRVKEVQESISAQFHFVEPVTLGNNPCRDPDDAVVLATAIAAEATCIVTGDKDLLVLGAYRDIAILTPRAFYDRVKEK